MLLVDTSVVLKWFRDEGESEVTESRMLLDAHRLGRVQCLVIDLIVYELGNVLLRPLRRSPGEVRDCLTQLPHVCGPPVHPRPAWFAAAADLGHEHGLTFYDACWAAAARALDCPLVSADKALLRTGLAITATRASLELSL